jgi:hypothetical protein
LSDVARLNSAFAEDGPPPGALWIDTYERHFGRLWILVGKPRFDRALEELRVGLAGELRKYRSADRRRRLDRAPLVSPGSDSRLPDAVQERVAATAFYEVLRTHAERAVGETAGAEQLAWGRMVRVADVLLAHTNDVFDVVVDYLASRGIRERLHDAAGATVYRDACLGERSRLRARLAPEIEALVRDLVRGARLSREARLVADEASILREESVARVLAGARRTPHRDPNDSKGRGWTRPVLQARTTVTARGALLGEHRRRKRRAEREVAEGDLPEGAPEGEDEERRLSPGAANLQVATIRREIAEPPTRDAMLEAAGVRTGDGLLTEELPRLKAAFLHQRDGRRTYEALRAHAGDRAAAAAELGIDRKALNRRIERARERSGL